LDGDPLNNYLKRAVTWNPNGVLNEANNITIAGTHAYITTDDALVIVNVNNPLEPQLVKEIPFKHPHANTRARHVGELGRDEIVERAVQVRQRHVDHHPDDRAVARRIGPPGVGSPDPPGRRTQQRQLFWLP